MGNIQYSFPELKFEKPIYNQQVPQLNGISKLFETPQLKKPNDLLSSNPFIRRRLLLDMNNMTFDSNIFSNTTTNSVSAIPYIGDDEEKSFADSELGRNLGNLFSSGLNSAGNTVFNNILKKTNLLEGMEQNSLSSLAGAGTGLAANYIGQGISSLGGDSMLSKGIGQGISTGLGTIGGNLTSSLFSEGSKGLQFSGSGLFGETQAGTINPYALGASMIGTGLSAAFGPSKEYNGKYGSITKGMDTAYDAVQGAVGFIPGYGQGIAAAMALNKGLSNIFGSTDGMCVCAGTKIFTASGDIINIEDLLLEQGIIGWDENSHSILPNTISGIIEPRLKECLEIELKNGTILRCSIDHPILSNIKEKAESHRINGKRIAYREWSFRRADELQVGNWIGLANNIDYWGTEEMPNAYLVGMLIGDGTYTYESSCKLWTADPSTWKYLEENNLAVLIEQYTPENSNGKYSIENRDYRIINGMQLVKDLGIAYLKGQEKTLPKNIGKYNKDSICKLIAGLYDTDGSFSVNEEKGDYKITLYQSNLELLENLKLILQKLGIFATIYTRKASINKMSNGRIINSNQSYRLELTDRNSIINFYKNIPLNIDYKKEHLEKIYKLVFPKLDKDHCDLSGAKQYKIVSIKHIGILTVYNLEASETHTYLANGIITHNTKQDAILGSAFMPAPVKWLNMAGASKTGTFNNLSWLNSEKTTSFMGNAFGNLGKKFDQAREEAGKTYGTFSQGAKRDAQRNIDFANNAWNRVLAMADLDELQRIRSLYMTSINNLRYAQMILGGWNPLAIGKQGMKIFNNATNHNMGMRLLSAAALIDNKQMILSALAGTKLYGLNRGNKDNIFKYTNSNGDVRYVYQSNPEDEEVPVRPLNTIFPDPAQWTFTDDAGKFYTPRRTTTTNTAELNPDNRTGFERALDNYIGEAFNTVPKGYHTLPAIGAAAFGLANPALGEVALTSGFGAHGLSKWVNGEVNGPLDAATTALEVTPLGRLAKPVYKGVIQPGMKLFNSPLTGNWTKIGNREYRFKPGYAAINGTPVESRPVKTIRLYRATGTNGKFDASLDGGQEFAGQWFTNDPTKPLHYASRTVKRAKRAGVENPIELLYVDIPESELSKYKASEILKGRTDIEYEPTEDFLIPLNYPRLRVPLEGYTGNLLMDARKPLPGLSIESRPVINNLTSHVQGEDAVRMFKEYGGTPIPEGSINGEQLRKYVMEARERYGLIGNNNITDEEIAQALYKHSKELGGNTAAVNAQGEPLLLFRGNTLDFTEFKPRKSPKEFINIGGTMDNSLGTLFLGELPNKSGDIGIYRYLVRGNDFMGKVVSGAGAGNKARPVINGLILNEAGTEGIQGTPVLDFPQGTTKVILYPMYNVYKLPPQASSTGYNAVDAYVVRTPTVRDVTLEMKTVPGEGEFKPFSWLIPKESRIGLNEREVLAKQYQEILTLAEKNQQGLLKSNKGTAYRGDEHGEYDYFALPNFNIRNAKHLLPYDLRIPRDWSNSNIYKAVTPYIIGGSTTATLYNTNK